MKIMRIDSQQQKKQTFGSVYIPKNAKSMKWVKDLMDTLGGNYMTFIDSKIKVSNINKMSRHSKFVIQEQSKAYKVTGWDLGDEAVFLSNYEDEFSNGKLVPNHYPAQSYVAMSKGEVSAEDVADSIKKRRLGSNRVKQGILQGIQEDYEPLLKRIEESLNAGLIEIKNLPPELQGIFKKNETSMFIGKFH